METRKDENPKQPLPLPPQEEEETTDEPLSHEAKTTVSIKPSTVLVVVMTAVVEDMTIIMVRIQRRPIMMIMITMRMMRMIMVMAMVEEELL
jgi:hypothetical protein